MVARPMWARDDPAGDQVIDVIVDHGYRPPSIVARAGVQLRVVF